MDWYDYPTNYSGNLSVGGVGDFFMKYPSFILGNYVAMGIIAMIWVMIFGISLAVGSRRALVAASFPTFILSLYWLKYINPVVPVLLIFLSILGALGAKEENL